MIVGSGQFKYCVTAARWLSRAPVRLALWLLTRGPAGAVESVQYHGLIPMLLNEPQRQEGPETSIGRTVDAAGRGCPPFRLVGKSLSISV